MNKNHVQSPIEISSRNSKYIDDSDTLEYHGYCETNKIATIENTGYSAMVKFSGEKKSFIIGGPLNQRYLFEQLHFHWAENDTDGCEHTLEGKTFSMEAHMVHFNEKYGNFETAIDKSDGLAVVAFFIQASGHQDCQEFKQISDKLSEIQQPNSKCDLNSNCLSWLMFQELKRHYYTYFGSLTTHPYSECVCWIIYRSPIYVSIQQVAAFRQLGSFNENGKIIRNCRPIQKSLNKTPKILFTRNTRIKSKL